MNFKFKDVSSIRLCYEVDRKYPKYEDVRDPDVIERDAEENVIPEVEEDAKTLKSIDNMLSILILIQLELKVKKYPIMS